MNQNLLIATLLINLTTLLLQLLLLLTLLR